MPSRLSKAYDLLARGFRNFAYFSLLGLEYVEELDEMMTQPQNPPPADVLIPPQGVIERRCASSARIRRGS